MPSDDMPVRKGGRPTKLTPERHDGIVRALKVGTYLCTAAALVGISESTLRDWLRRGARDADEGRATPYAALLADVEVAQAESEVTDLALITKAAAADWKAAAWKLSRLYPERYSERRQLEVSGPGQGPVVFGTIEEARKWASEEDGG